MSDPLPGNRIWLVKFNERNWLKITARHDAPPALHDDIESIQILLDLSVQVPK